VGIATTHSWLDDCRVDDRGYRNWWIEIELSAEHGSDSSLEVFVYSSEWGLRFRHADRLTNIRFSGSSCDVGRDDHNILDDVADLSRPAALFELLERRFGITLRRHCAVIRSNLPDAPTAVRNWLVAV
jgi:hypothetical protein